MEEEKVRKIWEIPLYFILYSIAGFLIETVYAIFTKGMLESRKCFVYGPFCSIYGLAAILMILCLNQWKHKPIPLYIGGVVIGLFTEYTFSYWGEKLFHVRWWDYSNSFGNIQGRICLFYAIIWGILALCLIQYIHPKIEKALIRLENKIHFQTIKMVTVLILVFMLLDAAISAYALENFVDRVIVDYRIPIENISLKATTNNWITKYFSNEKMIMIYPNLSITTTDQKVVYLGSLLSEYKNYYYRFSIF